MDEAADQQPPRAPVDDGWEPEPDRVATWERVRSGPIEHFLLWGVAAFLWVRVLPVRRDEPGVDA
jgi:hypothetical protein